MSNQLLLIEDNQFERSLYCRILEGYGYNVLAVEDLKSAEHVLQKHQFAVIIMDIGLPDGNGLDFVQRIKQQSADTEVIVFTGQGNIPDAIRAMKYGASDYLVKGEDSQRLITLTSQAIVKNTAKLKIDRAIKLKGFDCLIGQSEAIQKTKQMGLKVAVTDATVLLLGETGAGKDVLAECIHQASKRANHKFIAVNCSAVTNEMLESEFFGYKAGAFTGATKDKKGLFEEADKGTIFLDEIGEMSLPLQAKLLRFLQDGSFIKVGDTKTTYTNCRIIAATNVNLLQAAREGKFREDLYYRIAAFTIMLPPLRNRISDIPLLVDYYVLKLSKEFDVDPPIINDNFIKALLSHQWPGNVRELINVLKKSIILCAGELDKELLEFPEQQQRKQLASDSLDQLQSTHIKNVLLANNGNKRKSAKQLGISIATLYRKI